METKTVIIRGQTHTLPLTVYNYFTELIEWSEAMQKDARRQMVIQMQTSSYLRAATKVPDPTEKSWIAFCFYFPAYVAMAGIPNAQKLGSLLTDYFPLAYVAFRDQQFCLKDDHYGFKHFAIVSRKIEHNNPSEYELELTTDAKSLLHNICEALRHVGYDFGIVNVDQAFYHNDL